jgi:hypothetical protein
MTNEEKEQLDRLICEIADEAPTADRVERLERMLLDRPDLQSHYIRATTVRVVLGNEFAGGLGFVLPKRDSADIATSDLLLADAIRPTRDGSHRFSDRLFHRVTLLVSGLAAAVLVALGVGWLLGPAVRTVVTRPDTTKQGTTGDNGTSPSRAIAQLEINDARELAALSRLTRTQPITRVILPRSGDRSASDLSPQRLVGGNAWIDRAGTGRERGYVVALSPGYRMDVQLDSDAGTHNAIGIVELDPLGKMTSNIMSFNNLPIPGEAGMSNAGGIGRFSISNEGDSERFFLFSGSHKGLDFAQTSTWNQSNYKVLHESSDFLVLGWDDSGYSQPDTPELLRDDDFNDVCAMLHFAPLDGEGPPADSSIEYVPQTLLEMAAENTPDLGYAIDIAPGHSLLMMVTSSALLNSSFYVVDHDTQQVIWYDEGKEPLVRASDMETTTRGIYVIKNNSDTVRRYHLCAERPATIFDGVNGKIKLPHRVNVEEDHGAWVGFEDQPKQLEGADWNDLQVHVRKFTD